MTKQDGWQSSDDMLKELDNLRQEFDLDNEPRMRVIVASLVERGVYKETPYTKQCNNAFNDNMLSMVLSYGAYWHEYREPLNCPICNADLRSEHGPPFKREVGVYSMETDHTTHYACPDCKQEFNRFPPGNPFYNPEIAKKSKPIEISDEVD